MEGWFFADLESQIYNFLNMQNSRFWENDPVIVIAVSSALQSMGFGAKNDIKSVGHGGNRDEEIVSHCNRSIGQEPSGNTVPAVDLS